ncbi:hypothetical protein DPMN_161371 [Dreissena polymorpha]|uniref:Uncharacterized protein n=1 Tax=Dreissena polymorpha TaxID=45954 RepID=A0A9D4EQB1_DREPO|nr:hypothetical protein DPMN_161371 [Dreissena polymorpha]
MLSFVRSKSSVLCRLRQEIYRNKLNFNRNAQFSDVPPEDYKKLPIDNRKAYMIILMIVIMAPLPSLLDWFGKYNEESKKWRSENN